MGMVEAVQPDYVRLFLDALVTGVALGPVSAAITGAVLWLLIERFGRRLSGNDKFLMAVLAPFPVIVLGYVAQCMAGWAVLGWPQLFAALHVAVVNVVGSQVSFRVWQQNKERIEAAMAWLRERAGAFGG